MARGRSTVMCFGKPRKVSLRYSPPGSFVDQNRPHEPEWSLNSLSRPALRMPHSLKAHSR